MGKIVCIANRKGGVGKTTLSIGLAEALVSQHKKNVLIVDLDPQASATEVLLSDEHYTDVLARGATLPGYITQSLQGVPPAASAYVCQMRHSLRDRGSVNLALYPNSPELWDVEWQALRDGSEHAVRAAYRTFLGSVQDGFDVVIIDCPPGRTLGLEVSISMADLALCPVVPQHLAVWGMDRMRDYMAELQKTQPVPRWRFIVTMRNDATTIGRSQLEDITKRFRDDMLSEGTLLGDDRILSLQNRQSIPQRIALFRDEPDRIQSLEQFYGPEIARELSKIAKQTLKELALNG